MRFRTLGLLLFIVVAPVLRAQAPDDCNLTFVGSARRDVKLRSPNLSATYTAFGTASAPKSVVEWFSAACTWEAKRPATIPATKAIPGLEDQVATLQAYLLAVKFEADGDHDFHMELSADPEWAKSKHVIVEVPPGDAYCTARKAAWSLVTKDAGTTAPTNTYIFSHPPLVQVQGFVFFDAAHAVPHGCDDNGGRGIQKNGTASMVRGIWEVHPVVSIAQATPGPAKPGTMGVTETTSTTSTTDITGTTETTGTQGAAKPPTGTLTLVEVQNVHHDKGVTSLQVAADSTDTAFTVAPAVARSNTFQRLRMPDPTDPKAHGTRALVNVAKGTITSIEQVHTTDLARSLSLALGTLFLYLIAKLFFVKRSVTDLLRGKDGPYSNSKVQAALWFGILVIIYVAACLLRAYAGGLDHIGGVNIPPHLLLLSGISAFTFGAAKAIRVGQNKNVGVAGAGAAAAGAGAADGGGGGGPLGGVAAGGGPGVGAAPAGGFGEFLRDMTTGTDGMADIGDFQLVVIAVLAVSVYLVQIWAWLGNIPVSMTTTLPDVDTTILATFGLGQGAYLFKKQAE